ncbi:hypothetical protein LTR36_007087 [Oleoguttula mirabilis]|uniref:G-patch domain-containing protein n=1 Tax=Oleoguttula mirabilis TaxID=1507867 RepID=A0AAV9JB67_9PEZI|nr:hypothetical protein LTR36_007087 [Oleoguttula mirabilis]
MGLGAPKKRSKLSHDPNNTAWSKSTTSFGHRILSSQGWKPGDYLGAENATHGEHYTAANASHIRVMLREDNLGIGAKIGGKGNAETFGLSTLSGIFGRLNGKTDVEVEKQQSSLRDAELRTYQAQKFGFMNFVSGGLLVGDKIEELPDKLLAAKTVDGTAASADGEETASKKRKAESDGTEAVLEKSSKKKRKSETQAGRADGGNDSSSAAKESKKRRRQPAAMSSVAASESDSAEPAEPAAREKEDKQAKRERKERRRAQREERRSETGVAADEKTRLKQEKRARKEERRRRKEEKRRLKADEPDSDSSPEATASSVPASKSDGAISSGTSTPTQASLGFGGSRHAVRQRYIMQKRMASMDPRAMNEILMIKTQA